MTGAPDLDGLPKTFVEPRSVRQVVAQAVQILVAVLLLISTPGSGNRVLVVLAVLSGVSAAVALARPGLWAARTVIDEEGLRLPRAWATARRVPWGSVREVRPAWYPRGQSTVVLTDGRLLPLRYVPAEVAGQLAARLGEGSRPPP